MTAQTDTLTSTSARNRQTIREALFGNLPPASSEDKFILNISDCNAGTAGTVIALQAQLDPILQEHFSQIIHVKIRSMNPLGLAAHLLRTITTLETKSSPTNMLVLGNAAPRKPNNHNCEGASFIGLSFTLGTLKVTYLGTIGEEWEELSLIWPHIIDKINFIYKFKVGPEGSQFRSQYLPELASKILQDLAFGETIDCPTKVCSSSNRVIETDEHGNMFIALEEATTNQGIPTISSLFNNHVGQKCLMTINDTQITAVVGKHMGDGPRGVPILHPGSFTDLSNKPFTCLSLAGGAVASLFVKQGDPLNPARWPAPGDRFDFQIL